MTTLPTNRWAVLALAVLAVVAFALLILYGGGGSGGGSGGGTGGGY